MSASFSSGRMIWRGRKQSWVRDCPSLNGIPVLISVCSSLEWFCSYVSARVALVHPLANLSQHLAPLQLQQQDTQVEKESKNSQAYKAKKATFPKYSKKYELEDGKKDIQATLEKMKKYALVIRVLAHTQVKKLKGLKQKKASLMEIQMNGGTVAQKEGVTDHLISSKFYLCRRVIILFLHFGFAQTDEWDFPCRYTYHVREPLLADISIQSQDVQGLLDKYVEERLVSEKLPPTSSERLPLTSSKEASPTTNRGKKEKKGVEDLSETLISWETMTTAVDGIVTTTRRNHFGRCTTADQQQYITWSSFTLAPLAAKVFLQGGPTVVAAGNPSRLVDGVNTIGMLLTSAMTDTEAGYQGEIAKGCGCNAQGSPEFGAAPH
eukprot:Gb_26579 [translate_table: standard]